MRYSRHNIYERPLNKNRLNIIEVFFNSIKKKVAYLQSFMLIIFLILIIIPVFSKTPQQTDTIKTSFTLLSQFLFWGVWYGACLFSVIPFGRLWCGILCPLGAASEWAGKLGLKRKLPKWASWDGWLIVMFFAVTIMGQTLDVRDDPWGMIKLFGYIFILALIISIMFSQNSGRPWCRYFCPIGKILGVVSRLGIIDFRANNGTKKLTKYKSIDIQGKLCPTDYNLPYKNSTNN